MTVDLSRLLQPIAPSSAPDLEASDERLLAIDTLAQKGRFEEASAKVEALMDEGIFDIRPLPYHLYRAFEVDGFRGLGAALEVTANLLGPSFTAVAPARRREDLFNKRLAWLFDKVDKALEYHEKRRTPEWERWAATLSVEATDRALAAAAEVARLLVGEVYDTAGTTLGILVARLRVQAEAARAAAPPPVVEPAATATAPAPAPATAPAAGTSAPVGIQPVSVAFTPSAPPPSARVEALPSVVSLVSTDGTVRMELTVSHAFLDLCRKLRAFEALVQKQRFDRAAVLADDLARTIDGFDPRAHFPELFARFVALQSKHVGTLVEHAARQDSPAWRALQQYCRVDLAGFVEGDP